jgi:hypothetical protein
VTVSMQGYVPQTRKFIPGSFARHGQLIPARPDSNYDFDDGIQALNQLPHIGARYVCLEGFALVGTLPPR